MKKSKIKLYRCALKLATERLVKSPKIMYILKVLVQDIPGCSTTFKNTSAEWHRSVFNNKMLHNYKLVELWKPIIYRLHFPCYFIKIDFNSTI